MSYKFKDRVTMNPQIPSDTVKKALLNVLGNETWIVSEKGEADKGVWVRGISGIEILCLRDWITPESNSKLEVTSDDLMTLLE